MKEALGLALALGKVVVPRYLVPATASLSNNNTE